MSPDHRSEDCWMPLLLLVSKYEIKCFKISFARPVYNVSLPAFLLLGILNKLGDKTKVDAAVSHPKEVNNTKY